MTASHLDGVRGLAALLVLLGHVRGLLLVPFPAIAQPHWWDRVVYFASGLGHQSVVVFFVLSGYFVGGSILRAEAHWSWRDYLGRRFVRLYVVLLPALLVTWLADQTAERMPAAAVYYHQAIENFQAEPIAGRMSPTTLLGNALFLQTILVPVYGSNSALWSLANEAWYYLLFPLVWLAARRRSLIYAVAAVLVASGLPAAILASFPLWCLGVAAAAFAGRLGLGWRCASGLLCAGAIVVARLAWLSPLMADYAVGFSLALWLASLPATKTVASFYARVTRAMAGCSYSLYAVHLPLLTLIRVALPPGQWQPGWPGYGLFALVVAGLVVVAYGFARVTEAHTDAVRRWAPWPNFRSSYRRVLIKPSRLTPSPGEP